MTSRRSTTRRRLLWSGSGLLVLTAVATLLSWLVFHQAQTTADAVRARNVPAVLEAATARSALASANALAVHSFRTGEARLAGPGEEYQAQIALASQYLAQVAEHNAAGAATSRRLQLVEGLLVSYTGWIGQADAHLRQGGKDSLGAADLWYATQLLHAENNGILAELDELLADQQRALDDELSAGAGVTWLLWAVPVLLLLVLLAWTQGFLARSFRRRFNPYLLAATLLVLAMGVLAFVGTTTQRQVTASADELRDLVGRWQERTDRVGDEGQRALLAFLQERCSPTGGACGDTVARVGAGLGPETGPADTDDRGLTESAEALNASLTDAADEGGLRLLVPAAGAAVVLLVLFGLRDRFEEYRYRSR